MSLNVFLVLCAGALIAFVNGANDVSKGIATLIGSGVTRYREAIRWGAIWTVLGSLVAASLAGAMIQTFGRDLLAPGVVPSSAAALGTILGAAAWLSFATSSGFPVSTTHALVGALAGVGLIAYRPGVVRWDVLATKIALPLLLSPLISFLVTYACLKLRRPSDPAAPAADCICAELRPTAEMRGASAESSAVVSSRELPEVLITVAPSQTCIREAKVTRLTFSHVHWVTSGAVSFARGMNDAPKIAALVNSAFLLSAASTQKSLTIFVAVAGLMGAGSLFGGRRVTAVLAEKVTKMNHSQGLIANLVTSVLVIVGAVYGAPMSTTHVSSTAIIAVGVQQGSNSLNQETVRQILLAWLLTVPASGLMAMLAYAGLHFIQV
jgi:PiT family inorganic phosphate transporter